MKQIAVRTLKQSIRNPAIIRSRTLSTMVLALLIGLIYYQLSDGTSSNYSERLTAIMNRNGALFLCTIAMFNLSMIPNIIVFPAEKGTSLKFCPSSLFCLQFLLSQVTGRNII